MKSGIVYESAGADFDEHRIYRYSLHRTWDGPGTGLLLRKRSLVLWIMLNPSTADEHVLDPTLRRCQAYSLAWGYDGFEVCNLFAFRSTDPKVLPLTGDPVGPENDRSIRRALRRTELVICGWGIDGRLMDRDAAVLSLIASSGAEPLCLYRNKDGTPGHPLYLRSDLLPVRL